MNDFYKQAKVLQWIEAILLLIIGFLPAMAIIELAYSQPLIYFLFVIYIPVGQFSTTPFFKLIWYLQVLFSNATWLYGKRPSNRFTQWRKF